MSAQEFVAARESIYLSNCCNFAVTALLAYEYLITLDREVALFWRRRVTGASVLFFTNRYLVLVVYLLLLMYLVPMSDHSCLLLARSSTVLGYLQIIPQAAFSAMRALALSGMNWSMAGAVFLLAVVPFGTNMVTFSFSSTVQYNPLLGECLAISNITKSQAIIFTAVSRGCLMASDVILIVLTWYRLARAGIANWGDFKLRGSSFSGILLKDGSAYFLTLLLVNLMHMISTLVALSPLARSADHISYVSAFTYMATSVLVSRFLLDLQAANTQALSLVPISTIHYASGAEASTMQYAHSSAEASTTAVSESLGRVMGSVGTPLGMTSTDENEDGMYDMDTLGEGDSVGAGRHEKDDETL